MKRITFAVVAAILALGLIAGPALAANPLDAGVVIGASARVAKGAACGQGTGGGIGLPILNDGKKATYRFDAAPALVRQSVLHGTITNMVICGQVDPVDLVVRQVGAACGMSSGNNGGGSATAADGTTVTFSGLGWDVSAASVFVVTGNAVDNSTPAKAGGVLALVSARGVGAQCANKQLAGKTGGMDFTVDFVYVLGQAVPAVKHTK